MRHLFTERHGGTKPRVSEELDEPCRVGLLGLVEARISEGWFGLDFPFVCQYGRGTAGTDNDKLNKMMAAYGVIGAAERNPADGQVFDLIELCADVPTTTLNSGECFTIDECRDGEAVIEGGREGERTLAAFETCDGSWPDFHADMHAVNVVLVAVKAEQNVTDHIERLYSCSCFVSNTRKAVYPLSPTMRASLQVEPRLESKDVREKADRIRSMLQGMMSDSDPSALELFDSMVVDKTKDDNHLRLWYLRLWQAVEDAKKHLGYPQLRNIDTVIAGKRTPKELYDCRTNIAHWYTGRIDFSELNDLQDTAMELLRRKYQPTQDAGSVGRSE